MNWDWEKLQDKRQDRSMSGPDLKNLGEGLKRMTKFRIPGGPKLIIAIIALLWLASGIYTVGPGELGVVQRFGAYNRTTGPGPHYHIPFPVESVQTPNVAEIRKVEVGYKTLGQRADGNYQYKDVPEEALVLTGDENIISVQIITQYQISDPVKWLFRVQRPDETVKAATEAALREVIGNKSIDSALTTGKLEIQKTTKELLQSILDRYNTGVTVVAVQLQDVHPPQAVMDAFKDVASAQEDKNKSINEAEAYRNDLLPRARGEAAATVNAAQAYSEQVTRRATGEASRFLAVLAEYNKAKDITRSRMYLETMENIFANPKLEKIIIGSDALKQSVPYLPLDRK